MANTARKNLIAFILTVSMVFGVAFTAPVFAESLFKAGVVQTAPMTPRSWFASIRATTVGDVVTILINEKTDISSTVDLSSNKKTSTQDSWSPILDKILPGKGVVPNFDGWGGSNKVTNSASVTRSNSIKQQITTQVVQVMPNGNLVVQGRKSVINSGERQDFIISGIVNPRHIDGEGSVDSNYVANLQLAIVGKGTVSRAQSDGVMSKFLRLLF